MKPGACRFWMTGFGLPISEVGDLGLSTGLNLEASFPPNQKSKIENLHSHQ